MKGQLQDLVPDHLHIIVNVEEQKRLQLQSV